METKEEIKQTPIVVTDKELLLFCNLTNLKMEYTNLQNEEKDDTNIETTKTTTQHTIYSLLHGDEFIDAANKKDFSVYMEKLKGEVFVDRYSDEKGNFKIDDSKKGRKVYTEKDNLLEISPIVFDCLGNEKDEFLQKWEIAYSGDAFLVTLDFFRMAYNDMCVDMFDKEELLEKYVSLTRDDLVKVA